MSRFCDPKEINELAMEYVPDMSFAAGDGDMTREKVSWRSISCTFFVKLGFALLLWEKPVLGVLDSVVLLRNLKS
jgi:hypothetical protein